ncbi:MAG: diguanylate cyclase [Deltaproteobacteria bacterium]|nr:diguanylate cyclase [Deltaproteobacteria bacterium]
MSDTGRFIKDPIARKYMLDISPEISQDFASRKFQEINILLKAGMISNLNMEFKVSLHVLCDLVSEMIPYDRALLYLRNNDLDMVRPFIIRGFSQEIAGPLTQGNLFVEWCMQSGKTFFVPCGSDDLVNRCLTYADAASMISVPIYASNNIIGTLQLFSKETNSFSEDAAKLLWLLMIQSEALFRDYETNGQEDTAVPLHNLPGQANLLQFHEQLDREIGRAKRRKNPMSLLLMEMDHWDEYVRQCGHLKGEQTLREISTILMDQIRQIDTVCRYGEDRFALILTETDRKGGLVFADRLRETISRHLFQDETGERSVRISISAGLVTFPFDAKDKMALIHSMEEALQTAREQGGDQVTQYPQQDPRAAEPEALTQQLDLNRVTRTIHSVFNMGRLIELIVEVAMETLHAEKGSLLLAEPGTGQFVIRAACGFGNYTELIKNTRVPADKTVTGWVAAGGKPVVAETIESIPAVHKNLYKDYKNGSFLSIPLRMDGKTLGVIHLSNKTDGGTFTEEDLRKILPLSAHLTDFLKEGLRFEEIQNRFSKTALASLAMVLEAKDTFHNGHSERVARYTENLAKRMKLTAQETERLILSARLHDIGKIAIRSELYNKKGKLSEEETAIIRRHPFFSWKILDALATEEEEVKNTVLQHHEKLNGSGYPYGLVGDQIPLPARILCVADTFVSMTSNRAWRKPFSEKAALQEMQNLANVHFDPQVLQKLSEIVH